MGDILKAAYLEKDLEKERRKEMKKINIPKADIDERIFDLNMELTRKIELLNPKFKSARYFETNSVMQDYEMKVVVMVAPRKKRSFIA